MSCIAYLKICLLSIHLANTVSGARESSHRAFVGLEDCSNHGPLNASETDKDVGHGHTVERSGHSASMVQGGAAQRSHHKTGTKVAYAPSQAFVQGQTLDGLAGAAPRQTHALAQMRLSSFANVEDLPVHLYCLGIGALIVFAVALLYTRTTMSITMSVLTRHVFLTCAIASTWVGTVQFAQIALARSNHSLTPLIVWANASLCMFLAIPYNVQRLWQRSYTEIGQSTTLSSSSDSADVFRTRHTVIFSLIAFVTNFAYIAALRFLSASLNTAVFSTTTIFTFALTLLILKGDPVSVKSWGLRAICVCFSVLGVVFIAVLSSKRTDEHHVRSMVDRLMGVALSIIAAFGTAVYQVAFKYVFGDRMTPAVVGLFLASLGAMACVCYGSLIFGGIAYGFIDIDFTNVPWKFVLLTALSSMVFNFLIKFGIISSSPLSVNLATQLGIPLNLGVDLLIVQAKIEPIQILGVMIMLVSFSLNSYLDRMDMKSQS